MSDTDSMNFGSNTNGMNVGSKVISENKYDKLIQYSNGIIEEYPGKLMRDIRDYMRDYPDKIDRIDKLLYKYAISVIFEHGDILSKEELELLLYRKHENINIFDYYGKNIFHILCWNKAVTLDIIKYVIEETDININKVSCYGKNALHYLCSNKAVTLSMIKYIIEETDIDINRINIYDKKPIYYLSDDKIEIKEYLSGFTSV